LVAAVLLGLTARSLVSDDDSVLATALLNLTGDEGAPPSPRDEEPEIEVESSVESSVEEVVEEVVDEVVEEAKEIDPMANWFIGLAVPAGTWFERLTSTAPEHLRTFHAEDLHMTVAFLGPCGEEKAQRAWSLASTYEGEPFEVVLDRLVGMGNPRRPSALSLLLAEGREAGVAVIRALRDRMIEAAEARADTRPPKPHITVARPARKAGAAQRHEAFTWALNQPAVRERVTLDTICLYTWSRDRRARQFQVVASRRLGS
jgi:2'-5' RNA ligase